MATLFTVSSVRFDLRLSFERVLNFAPTSFDLEQPRTVQETTQSELEDLALL